MISQNHFAKSCRKKTATKFQILLRDTLACGAYRDVKNVSAAEESNSARLETAIAKAAKCQPMHNAGN